MACHHKFQSYLNFERLDFDPTTLIVGTFNPDWPDGNYAEWFYGRTDNNYFWDHLPRMCGEQGMRGLDHTDWKTFCKEHNVALTDLITSIADADEHNLEHRKVLGEYTDSALASKFKEHTPTNVTDLLRSFPSIRSVYLTTTIESGLWQRLWSPIEVYCHEHRIWCRKLMTPSKGARFFMKKGSGISMPDFIYNDWISKWRTNE